jgi:hypothetical protein
MVNQEREDDLVYWKTFMYGTLSFFLTASGMAFLMLTLLMVLYFLVAVATIFLVIHLDPELWRLILNHIFPQLHLLGPD